MTTSTDSIDHTPGPLKIFERKDQTGSYQEIATVDPSDAFQCGGTFSDPPLELLCKGCAEARGYIW